MTATASYLNKWSFDTQAIDGSSPSFDFNEGSDFIKTQPILNAQGLMGTRKMDESRSRFGPYSIAASLTCEPSPAFLAYFLPLALGGGSATAPALADAIPEFTAAQDRTAVDNQYTGCKISRLSLSGSAGGLISCSMDVLGKVEDGTTWAGAALPSGGVDAEPFQFADLVTTLVSASRSILDFNLEINNNLRARFVGGSLTADQIIEGERSISLSCTSVFTATEASALYGLSKEGAAGTLVLTNGAVSTTFTFARVQIPDNGPRSSGGEIILPISAQVRGTALGAEFTCAVDSTP